MSPSAGLVAAVDDRVGHAVVVDEHRALAGRHLHVHAGMGGDLTRPGARCGDHELRPDLGHRAVALVAQRGGDDPAALAIEADDPLVAERLGAVEARVRQRRLDELPRLDRPVRHAEGPPDLPVERGLLREQVRDLHLVAVHAARVAVVRERRRRSRRGRPASPRSSRRCPPRSTARSAAARGSPRCTRGRPAGPSGRSGHRSAAGRDSGRWSRSRSRCARRAARAARGGRGPGARRRRSRRRR